MSELQSHLNLSPTFHALILSGVSFSAIPLPSVVFLQLTQLLKGDASLVINTPKSNTTPPNAVRRLSVSTTTSTIDDVLFEIPPHIISEALNNSRSRRNLPGRLSKVLFSDEERAISNYRGVKGKQKLDWRRTDAIRRACLQHFPPQQHEPAMLVEHSIREGCDEMLRSFKRPQIHAGQRSETL